MKIKSNLSKVVVVMSVVVFGLLLIGRPEAMHKSARAAGQNPLAGLTVEVSSEEVSYLPGELIAVKFRVRNEGETTQVLPGEASVWDGYLKVLIAYEKENYKEYLGPDWGLKDVRRHQPLELAPGGVYETDATILFNKGGKASHLSELYRKQVLARELPNGYGLARAGAYRLKAVLYDKSLANQVESEPITLHIRQPEGDDLSLWERMKDQPDYGYFLQTGQFRVKNQEAVQQLVENLRETVRLAPEGTYARSIRFGLAKYDDRNAKVKER